MLIGFQKLEATFRELVKKDSVFCAYLFFGRKGTGKSTFARMLANFFEHDKFEEPSETLRESFIINKGETNDETEKKEENGNEIKIDDIRDATRFLYKKPSFSKYRCVLIQDAENLNMKAQNALLKILEEPPKHGIIIATATDSSSITDTLMSRFERIYVPIIRDDKIIDFIRNYDNVDNNETEEIAIRSNGSIGRAIRIIKKDDDIDTAYNLVKRLFDKKENDNFVISETLNALLGEKQNHRLLEEFFEELFIFTHKKAPSSVNIEKEASNVLFFIRSVRVNKYIHLKNLLWVIRSHLYQLHS